MEMLNSNQALMETNLQGAVAVAIVTAAKLETQTRLLLDSFGAPARRWCQGRGSRRAGVHPWPRGVGAAGSSSAVPQVLLGLCHHLPKVGKPGMSLCTAKGKHSMGGKGLWDKCRDWQGHSRAWLRHEGQNAQATSWGLSAWCQTREVAWGCCGGCRVIP